MARTTIRRLVDAGFLHPHASHSKTKTYQVIEKLPIVDMKGQQAGFAEWPFSRDKLKDRLQQIVRAAIEQLAAGTTQTTINIGTLNVLIQQAEDLS